MLNPVESILLFNADREPERLALKYSKMRGDVFTFMRGTCHLFYERLQASPPPDAPLAWVCGDLHLENFGSYKGDNRLSYFDINDFDESALAPAAWDLVRLAASLLVGAKSIKVDSHSAADLCEHMVEAYTSALAEGKPRWIERDTAAGLIKTLLDSLRKRRRTKLLADWTEQDKTPPKIRLRSKHALKATADDHSRARDLVAQYASTQRNPALPPAFFDVLDVARRVAGTGSLGLERYVVLVRGKGTRNTHYLLDIKQSVPSSLAGQLGTPQQPVFSSPAARIVAVQRRMQAVSAAFLEPLHGKQHPYVLRGLQPQDDAVQLNASKTRFQHIRSALEDMARLTAWAHLRASGRQGAATADELIAFGQRASAWQPDFLKCAQHCAQQVAHDWEAYVKAYDDGTFGPPKKKRRDRR